MPTIAIVGASADHAKFGNKAVRAYTQRGYHVYPINPHEATIEGWPVYRSLADVPDAELDRVSFYLPPAVGLAALDDVARKKVGELWLNPGADSPEVQAKARQLGLNVVAACSIVDIGIYPDELD